MITTEAQLETVREATNNIDIPLNRIILVDASFSSEMLGCTSMNSLLAGPGRHWQVFDDALTSSSTTAALLSTSGTTGLPKMAARSHSSWITENQAIEDKCAKPYRVSKNLYFQSDLALTDEIRSGAYFAFLSSTLLRHRWLLSVLSDLAMSHMS